MAVLCYGVVVRVPGARRTDDQSVGLGRRWFNDREAAFICRDAGIAGCKPMPRLWRSRHKRKARRLIPEINVRHIAPADAPLHHHRCKCVTPAPLGCQIADAGV
jgi:hypothetical protein